MAELLEIQRTVIPKERVKKRVAAYARVSIQTEMLHHSLEAQVSYYRQLICNNPDWEFAGVYADDGITGTSTKLRVEFNRLIEDCNTGKIDIILVKSISRFARNTVDCLKTIRHLKDLGIAVCFERENINSMKAEGELLLTLLASFAQAESESISANVKWATRKRFEKGIPNGHKAPLGYYWNGEMFQVIPEQGTLIKEIYSRYLNGETAYSIAKTMAADGATGQMGKPLEESTVKNVLSSFSYTGSMVLQKSFFSSNHKRQVNKGELPRYVVSDMFEPLITQDEFDKVQRIRTDRAASMSNANVELTVFSGKIKCGYCGGGISRRTVGKAKTKKWKCNESERKKHGGCELRPLTETELIVAAETVTKTHPLDEACFSRMVEQIIVYGDRIQFVLTNNKVKEIKREYKGKRGPFTGKIKCGTCGANYVRDTWKYGPSNAKVKVDIWICKTDREHCSSKRVFDLDIKKASKEILGNNYELKVVEIIKEIKVFIDYLEFNFKDGTVIKWQEQLQ